MLSFDVHAWEIGLNINCLRKAIKVFCIAIFFLNNYKLMLTQLKVTYIKL